MAQDSTNYLGIRVAGATLEQVMQKLAGAIQNNFSGSILGTAGNLAKFQNGNTIGDSIVTDDGSTVNINGKIQASSGLFTGTVTVTGSFLIKGDIDATGHDVTASFFSGDGTAITNVQTASFASNVQSSSIAGTLSRPQLPSSISYEDEANTFTQDQILSGSLNVTGSITASDYQGVQSSSFASTASLLLGSVESASFASTASLLLGSIESASFADTASFAQSAGQSLTLPPTASISGTFVTQSIVGWYKSDVGITTAASGVARWEDQSGHGNHLTQSQIAVGAAEPAFIDVSGSAFTSLPAIRFDGVDDYLIASLSADLTGSGLVSHAPGITFGLTFRLLDKTDDFSGLLSFGRSGVTDFSDSNTLVFNLPASEITLDINRNNGGFTFKKYRNRNPQVVVVTMDGADIDVYQAHRHNTFADAELSLGVQFFVMAARKSGAGAVIGNFTKMDVAEFITYDVALNPSEADSLVEYLTSRAGI